MPISRRELLAAAALPLAPAALRGQASPGLRLGPGATVLKDGKPYRGVGINYFDCFYRAVKNSADRSYEQGFAVLARHQIPFVRFCGSGFWPVHMRLFRDDKQKYLKLLDGVVETATKHGIGLIPSLFWFNACVPDLVGEPIDQWGNPRSRTHEFMRDYVQAVVSRYRDTEAIWAWEFGNEYDSYTDLPNAATYMPSHNLPKTEPKMGTPASRTPRDYPRSKDVIVAYREFAAAVRRNDPYRLIDNGCSITGKRAWHYYHEATFKDDSPEQFGAMLALTSPGPVNLISVHCYQDLPKAKGFWRDEQDRLDGAAAAARRIGKPLFVGEFAPVNDYAPDSDEARSSFASLLAKLDRLRVPLAAAWVFDLPQQEDTHNITETNRRSWQLPAIREHNARLGYLRGSG